MIERQQPDRAQLLGDLAGAADKFDSVVFVGRRSGNGQIEVYSDQPLGHLTVADLADAMVEALKRIDAQKKDPASGDAGGAKVGESLVAEGR